MLQVDPGPAILTATTEMAYASAFTFLQITEVVPEISDGFIFHQSDRNIIPDTWILLDSQSTVSVFKNRQLLSNMRASPSALRVPTNGGMQFSSQMGTVKNFGDCWYKPTSISTILLIS